jgi:hypothetical protein
VVAEPVDRGLLKLRSQIDATAPNRAKGSDGFKGDESHASRTSDHNPESPPPPGNPDNQIDAGDFTHDPRSGADMGRISERIRLSRDRRVRYVIFNRRIFRSYARNGVPAWTWAPYTGSNPHALHMHVSVNDTHHDETQDWEIGMHPSDEKALINRMATIIDMDLENPVGANLRPEPNKLAEAINGISAAIALITSEVAKILPVLAAMARNLEGMSERLDSLEQGPAPSYEGTATVVLHVNGDGSDALVAREIDRGGQ